MSEIPVILFKLTTRSRPEWCMRALDSIYNNLLDKENFRVLVSMDSDDSTMANPSITSKLGKYKNLTYSYGNSKTKMQAINADSHLFPENWHILVNVSDDQYFTSMFFDKTIRMCFGGDFDLALHLPDQSVRAALMTMAILGRDFYNRFNFIYHPEYISLFCDNEMQDVARHLGKYRYVDVYIFIHAHPAWGMSNRDAQYIHTESFYKHDKATYEKRKERNFDLNQYSWYNQS